MLGKLSKFIVIFAFGLLGMAVGALLIIAVGFTLYDLAPRLFKDEIEVFVYVAVGLVFSVFCGMIYGARTGVFVWEWLKRLAND